MGVPDADPSKERYQLDVACSQERSEEGSNTLADKSFKTVQAYSSRANTMLKAPPV